MRRYNPEFKENLLKKVFTKNDDISIRQIAFDANIPPETLYSWLRKLKKRGSNMTHNNYSKSEKFELCLRYFNLDESEKGKFLRQKGLKSYQLDSWRSDFTKNKTKHINSENIKHKRKIKELKKELRRKEKALAETATLLTLKKKFQEMIQDKD